MKNKTVVNWKNKLGKTGFLRKQRDDNREIYTLKTPLQFRFTANLIGRIRDEYNPDFEVGGILFAVPKLEGDVKVLEVEDMILLDNLSINQEDEFAFSREEFFRICRQVSTQRNEGNVPIFFHSHPVIDLDEVSSIESLRSTLAPLRTSQSDQRLSLQMELKMGEFSFLVPNVLIVKSNLLAGNFVVGFYGGGITPLDFADYIIQVTGKTLQDLMSSMVAWVKKDPKRIWIMLLLSALIALPIIYWSKKAIPLILVFLIILLASQMIPVAKNERRFFAVIKEREVTIEIPEFGVGT